MPAAVSAGVDFEFTHGSEFDLLNFGSMPRPMERDGVSLIIHSIYGPVSFADSLTTDVEPGLRTLISEGVGLAVDSGSINNADFAELFGNDVHSESRAMNFLESVTFSFDHSVILSELVFADLEEHEKFIVEVEGVVTQDLLGTRPWSADNSGPAPVSGSALGALEGLLIEQGTPITFTFDTVDPLDRIPDGTGNDLSASPSSAIMSISVAFPEAFRLGAPYVIQGGPNEAVVGVELWGSDAEVTVRWSEDPETGWTHSENLGTRSPIKIDDVTLTDLTPNTTWYFQFVADDGDQTVESPVQSFAWATKLYVSPGGHDTQSGFSPGEAMATIDEALRRIRAMGRRPQPEGPEVPMFYTSPTSPHGDEISAHLDNLVDPVTVVLLPGYHYLDDTVVIDKSTDGNIHFVGQWADGAEEDLRARLMEHGGDPDWMDPPSDGVPVVSGGREITGWETTTVNGVDAWVAEVPEVAAGDWYFHQLFVDGRRAERSRWPKLGWYRVEAGDNDTRLDFQIKERDLRDIDIENWRNLNDVQTVLLHRWVESRIRVGTFDPETRWVNLLPPAPDPGFTFLASAIPHGAGLVPYFFDNVFETMSEPGEWYLDRADGRLYYIPLPGQTIDSVRVHAPRLRELFRISGRESGTDEINERLWNVGFRRIAFLHTQVDEFDLHTGTGNSPYNSGRGAIHYRYARAPYVEACLFGHVGEWGVEFAKETVGGSLSANIFRSMAFGAFKMWQNNQISGIQERSGWAHINDNDVFGFARYWFSGVGLLVHETVFSTIENNHVHSAPHNAINASGGGRLLRFGFANLVRDNYVHDIGQGVLSDITGIRISGKSPHSVVEHNVVHNINARDYTSPTFYLDGEAEYWTVRRNWFYGANERGANMKGWSHNVYNNVIAFAGDHLVNRRNSDTPAANSQEFPLLDRVPPVYERNIFLLGGGGYVYNHEDYNDTINPWIESDNNLFRDMTAEMWVGRIGETLEDFQNDQEQDLNSLEADPLFINPHRGDFRLDPASPAVTELGFEPFDNRNVGPRKEVWNDVGAVWYRPAAVDEPDWLPSDVSGLHAWLDAADMAGKAGPLHQWDTKSPYTYMMRQFDTGFQPAVVPAAVNGLPVVRFTGTDWMGNHEHSWRTRRHSGQFQDREFTIIAVSSAPMDNQVLLAKGDEGTGGQWTIGETANAFRWDGTQTLGGDGEGFAVRTWRRGPSQWEYYVNGTLSATSTDGLDHVFDSEEILYLGRGGGDDHFVGDVGEILIYRGSMSTEDLADIHAYLVEKWLEPTAPTAQIFTAESIDESRAAYGNAYLRTLTGHVDEDIDPVDLTFAKVSGPAWLTVAPDGTLGGTPDAADTGLNTFEVRATDAAGGEHVVTLQVLVAAPNPDPATPPVGVIIEASGEGLHLQWEASADPDFSHYIIRRSSTLENFETFAQPVWTNQFIVDWNGEDRWFFTIRAVNTSGN
ncbi:MAG: right-handed parallel beta-helix repeat-containing protein [Opitutales bacterium]|nr:right-handed parallel beta-helix repeat-containing protein [Opitutales bacterium]